MAKRLTGLMTDFKCIEETLVRLGHHDDRPMYFVAKGCCYFPHYRRSQFKLLDLDGGFNLAWVTLIFEDPDDGCYSLELACEPPYYSGGDKLHWLAYVMEQYSLAEYLALDDAESQVRFMLQEGIAPGQRFLVEMSFWSSRDYWGEWDEGLDMRVMDREPWTEAQHVEAWMGHLKTTRCIEG